MSAPTIHPPRRAPQDMPNLPALRRDVQVPPPPPMLRRPRTLAECVEPFLFWLRGSRGRAAHTIEAYRKDLACFTAFCREAGLERPDEVTHQLIEFYLAWLQEAGGRSRGTAVRRFYVLRSFFRYLKRERLVPEDPAAEAYSPGAPGRQLPEYLTAPEQERVLAALAADPTLEGRRDYTAVMVLLFTGLRAGELLTLTVDRVNLETGILRVVQGKGRKDREIPIIPRLATILRTYLTEVRPRCWQADVHPYLFLRLDWHLGRVRADRPLERHWLSRLVNGPVSQALGRKVSPHKLRHSFASRIREAGGDLALIQEALGHAHISTTLIYAHITTRRQRDELARLLETGG